MAMRASVAVLVMTLMAQTAPARRGTVTVVNPTADQRRSETVTMSSADLQRVLGAQDVRLVHVRDETGADLLTQPVDLNDDGTFDEVIFQTDLSAKQTKRFGLTVGERRIPRKEEFRAYGRFVRERRDDFAWENELETLGVRIKKGAGARDRNRIASHARKAFAAALVAPDPEDTGEDQEDAAEETADAAAAE